MWGPGIHLDSSSHGSSLRRRRNYGTRKLSLSSRVAKLVHGVVVVVVDDYSRKLLTTSPAQRGGSRGLLMVYGQSKPTEASIADIRYISRKVERSACIEAALWALERTLQHILPRAGRGRRPTRQVLAAASLHHISISQSLLSLL